MKILFLLTFIVLAQCRPWDWPFISSSTTSTTPKAKVWSNETIFGECEDDDKVKN